MSQEKCHLVKDIYYDETVNGLPTFKMRKLLKDNGQNGDGFRSVLCQKIRSEKSLLSQIPDYAPEARFFEVGRRRRNLKLEDLEVITWDQKLKEWEKGQPQTYPSDIEGRFFYETSISGPGEPYDEVFIQNSKLDELEQSYDAFSKHIANSKNKYVTNFLSIDGTAMLLIPKPIDDYNYTTMKDFIDNAPEDQRVMFWKLAALIIRKEWAKGKKVYVSTHGLGVPYFHLRIEEKPKYYVTKRFKES